MVIVRNPVVSEARYRRVAYIGNKSLVKPLTLIEEFGVIFFRVTIIDKLKAV